MFKLLKFLPSVFAWRDVSKEVKNTVGQDKPFFLRQRFWGLVGAAGSVTVASALGFEIDKTAVTQLVDAMNALAVAINQIYIIVKTNVIPSVIAAWSAILIVKGQYDAMLREKLNGSNIPEVKVEKPSE